MTEAGLEEFKIGFSKFVSGKDAFVSLSTGYSKSLSLTTMFNFVQSLQIDSEPQIYWDLHHSLMAFMMDQREKFNSWGIAADLVKEV